MRADDGQISKMYANHHEIVQFWVYPISAVIVTKSGADPMSVTDARTVGRTDGRTHIDFFEVSTQ